MNNPLRELRAELDVANERIASLKTMVNKLDTNLVELKSQLSAKASLPDLLQMHKNIENKNMPLTDGSSEEHAKIYIGETEPHNTKHGDIWFNTKNQTIKEY